MRTVRSSGLLISLMVLVLSACSRTEEPQTEQADLWNLNVDPFAITISGIDSGAQLAMHFHHAHSERVRGIGLFAPRPYDCAQGSAERAVTECSGEETRWTEGQQQVIAERYRQNERARTVQSAAYLASDVVWIFRGEENNQVSAELTSSVVDWYQQRTHPDYVHEVYFPQAGHVWPTLTYGESCDSQNAGIAACELDAAGDMLRTLYGFLLEASDQTEPLMPLDQQHILGEYKNYFDQTGYAYVPSVCAEGGACSLHVALHGCSQSAGSFAEPSFAEQSFAKHSGLNRWAETNRLVILYPQAASGPSNSEGCWDWWGFSGDDYATLDGQHIEGLLRLIHYIGGVRTYSPDDN